MSLLFDIKTQHATADLLDVVKQAQHPLAESADLDPLVDAIGDARFVLLGEASHGTSDFYTWRARLSQRLIQEKGFSFIAVEGDWPDCYRVNRYIKGYADAGESAYEVLKAYERWPTWMWANWEIVALAEWLRNVNDERGPDQQIGFYGLDVYSLWESMASVMEYLEENAPEALETAKQAYMCFEPFGEDVQSYAMSTAMVPESCEDEVIDLLTEVRRHTARYPGDPEADFNAEQNALVTVGAERYYRAMVRGSSSSWNVRDHHMADTLDRLMEYHGADTKAIAWEHNTHIGDARATDMARAGMENVGQLVRERHLNEGVRLIGFGAHRGSVIAGRSWGAPMQRMTVPPAQSGSWEDVLHRAGAHNKLLLLDDMGRNEDALDWRGQRAIGVVYHPERESGNYVPTVLPQRYDAFLYIDESKALHPLHVTPKDTEPPQTYPWGL